MTTPTLPKYLTAASLCLLSSVSLSATIPTTHAHATSGEITTSTGALAALAPPGTQLSGSFEVDENQRITQAQVLMGGFCFSTDATNLPISSATCPPTKSVVPILATGSNAYDPDNTGAHFEQSGSSFNSETGGLLKFLAYSPTFGVNILIDFQLEANEDDGTGTMQANAGSLGTANGSLEWDPVIVPVPAGAWLFGSALIGLVGIKRQQRKRS